MNQTEQINELVFEDYMKLNKGLAEKTIKQLTEVFGKQILTSLFTQMLYQNWQEYVGLN